MTQATPPTSVRPELVEGLRSLLDQLALALACVEDELCAMDRCSLRDAIYNPFPVVDHERTQATLETATFALIQIAKGLAALDKVEVPS